MTDEATHAEVPQAPRRRWRLLPRFGLRTLLVLTTLACIALAVWSVYIDPYRQQAIAVTRIRELGGIVEERSGVGPGWQRWLVETFMGEEGYSETYGVQLHQTEIDDDLQTQLGRLPFVERLNLDGAGIDDSMLAALLPGDRVRELSLRYTQVTDDAMAAVARFPKIERLSVTGANVTDVGLELLSDNPSLGKLFIRWTDVTAEGIEAFREARPECEINFHVQ